MLCNCSPDEDPKLQLSPSLVNRAFLIDRLLRPDGSALFLYSPSDVIVGRNVPGYVIDGDNVRASEMPVPRVNANWTYGTRKLINRGMGYRNFKRWVRDEHIHVYVPYAFSELVSNKRKAYEAVSEFDAKLHPRTEDYLGSAPQTRSFLEASNLVFIKPRSGNRGNEIFVLERKGEEIALRYYEQGDKRVMSPLTLEAAMAVIEVAAGEKAYVIQEGVESMRYRDAVFDIRVCMVNDGNDWHSILETRLAPKNSDLSNVFQGGSIEVTEDLFDEIFDREKAKNLEAQIREVSHGLARHFDGLYPGDLMELGFDFVLDADAAVHLVEVNAKPGIAGFGSEEKLFDWKAADDAYYQKWVIPHVTHLASFFRCKAELCVET